MSMCHESSFLPWISGLMMQGKSQMLQLDAMQDNKMSHRQLEYTALHYASAGGHVSIMKRLVSSGCDQHVKNFDGETALHVASNVEVVDYLLRIGLNIEDCDTWGYTPFLQACRDCCLPVVRRLIQSKCNKAATTKCAVLLHARSQENVST
ncbi:ankyrin repeat and death domain-containing protein 1A-like [Corticium candelabrum]|uniref:ankyrin repeat and death domain-containing protein 1A-like n=1 Tax=Corticium candelabrum TaxID=121492 RepID=UPI002E253379|nr:ankyrin repeat and death domain-containing protein 1A-like [Corticium candelabrum]XP_062507134.1 ankyrin repeat and death domain-containing protein 1A-like [Corticium candelabrum]XP_062507136.1 ankyrin repeat and death domain-containing protein 1A-like [Corticium candelabrum]XP_062507137.1 ankyrin repeat and death domain-containing protein 1A-like [Corticium candelabrum]